VASLMNSLTAAWLLVFPPATISRTSSASPTRSRSGSSLSWS
jgi:hypothetical protein